MTQAFTGAFSGAFDSTVNDPTQQYRPSVQEVADLVRTRVVGEGGEMEPIHTFDATTWPTDVDVERIISQATAFIFPQITGSISETYGPACRHLAALYAAILVEASYFREQLTDDMVELYRNLLDAGIRGLGGTATSGEQIASRRIDTIVMRGVATVPPQYLWWLDLPETWEMPSQPPQVGP